MGGSAYAGSLIVGATVTNNEATFTTSGQYVNLPSGLFGSYTAVSVEAWVTTGVNSGYQRIFQFGDSATSNYNSMLVWCGSAPQFLDFTWFVGNSVGSFFATTVLFNNQTSLHLVMTVSAGANAKLYINGVLSGITSAVVNPIPQPNSFYIGKSFDGAPGLIGSVNEFRIWGGVLSATDIATRYSQGPGEASNYPV